RAALAMPQASERLLATPRINPRLPRSRPAASTMTHLENRCHDGAAPDAARPMPCCGVRGCRNSGFSAPTREPQDSASDYTTVLGLQAQLAAVCGGGNTSNPRVFTHGETSADAPPHAIEGEAGRRRELVRRSRSSELSVFAKDLEAAIPALRRYARALT